MPFSVIGVRSPDRGLLIYLLEGSRAGEIGCLVYQPGSLVSDRDADFIVKAKYTMEKAFHRLRLGWTPFEMECDVIVDHDQLEAALLLLLK